MNSRHISFHRSLTGGSSISWPDTIVIAAKAGFDTVDIELNEIPVGDYAIAKDMLDEQGIQAGVAPLPVEFRADEGKFAEDMETFAKKVLLAESLGIRIMTRSLPASSEIPKKEFAVIVRRRLRRVTHLLENHGIRLALEFMGPFHLRTARPYAFIWRMDETLEFATSVGSTVGLLVDSWHWHHIGGNKQDILSAGALILNVQVSDAKELQPQEVKDSERLLPGQGVVNFEEFFQGLRIVGYNGLITPEVLGYRSEFSNPILSARKALNATKDMLNKALLENK